MLSETRLKIPFSVIDRGSLVPTSHWLQGKGARINLSQAASGMILQNHRRQLRNKKLRKPSAHVQKVSVYFYKPSKIIFMLWHDLFNIFQR
jgi:hypothetical protein